jgi:hypothetical protein
LVDKILKISFKKYMYEKTPFLASLCWEGAKLKSNC